jgi:tetratricopeptide (TPR) repeat protein
VAIRARMFPSLLIIGAAHFIARRFDEAVPKLLLAIQENPGFPEPYRYLAACYAHMGRIGDAREVVARLRTISPLMRPDASYLRNSEHRDLLLSGLRLAAGDATRARPAAFSRCRWPHSRICGGGFSKAGMPEE